MLPQGDAQGGQHIGHGTAVRAHHGHLLALADIDHLNAVDMDLRDAVGPLGGEGVVLSQLQAGLLDDHMGVAAGGHTDDDLVAVGDDILGLGECRQGKTQRGQRNRQRQKEPAQHTAAMLLQRRRRADRQHGDTSFPKGVTVG